MLLADDLVDRPRPQAHGERRLARRNARAGASRPLVGLEELAFHATSIATREAAGGSDAPGIVAPARELLVLDDRRRSPRGDLRGPLGAPLSSP
jgi:hypothetical protein